MSRRALWLAAGVCTMLVLLMARSAQAVYIPFASPVDVDKSHGGGNWLTNWFDDVPPANGIWDFVPDNPGLSEAYGDINIWGQNGVNLRDESCWLASAANMLSAAGYGDGGNVYQALLDHYGWRVQGSQDQALAYYISLVGANEYSVINVYFNNGGMIGALTVQDFLSSEIRTPDFVGIGMSPLGPLEFDHAVTVWGDDLAPGWTPGGGAPATQLYITDSDMDIAGDYPLYDDVDRYGWTAPDRLNYGAAGYVVQSVVTLGAVPEPGTLALVGLGMICLAGCLRRKRKV